MTTLTDAEIRLLGLLVQGATSREIATELGWEYHEVVDRLRDLFKRLHCKNRTTLAIWWWQQQRRRVA